MKRTVFYILTALTLLSCAKEESPEQLPDIDYEGRTVTVYFGLETPEPQTKALSEQPDIRSLHVAVFGSSGYLKEYKLARPVNSTYVSQEGTAYKQGFEVDLSITSSRVRLHIIANGPESLDFDYESVVMSKLTSTNNQDAYWQRIILDHGIYADKTAPGYYDTPPVLTVDPNFDLDTDGTTHKLALVPLIRNFSRIMVSAADPAESNFVVNSFAVVNVPDQGSVAPYNPWTGDFMMGYQTYQTLAALSAVYPGNMPAETQIVKTAPTESDFTNLTNGVVPANGTVFMYERPVPTSDPTVLIVNGTYTDPKTHNSYTGYYKVDMMEGSEYLPILRNFSYLINIQKVNRKGKTTVSAAINGAGSADISADISTASQVGISDGVSSISVSSTEQTYAIGGTYTIGVSYIPDVSTGVVDNSYVTYELLAPGSTGAVIASQEDISFDASTGTLSFTTTDVDPRQMKSQVIRVIGTYNGVRLYREVIIRLLPQQTMTVTCTDVIQCIAGTPQTVNVTIPKDLPRSIFPLQFRIEIAAKSLTPNAGDLPVDPGETIVEGRTGNSYQFIKTISYSDYIDGYTQAGSQFTCQFKSVIAASDSDIYVANEYFATGHTAFTTYELRRFSSLQFSTATAINEDDPVTFSFVMDAEHEENKYIPETVEVTLIGLIPDYDNPNFRGQLEKKVGNHYIYSVPRPGEGTQRLYLLSTGEMPQYKVQLSALHYEDNEKENMPMEFINLSFGTVFYGRGWPTSFSFTIPDTYQMPAAGYIDIELTLTNLEPNDANISSSGGKYYYRATSTGTKTIYLRTTSTEDLSVDLAHRDFVSATRTQSTRSYLNIDSGKITNYVPNASSPFRNSNTVYVYTDLYCNNEVSHYTTNTSNSSTSVTSNSPAEFSSMEIDANTTLYLSMASRSNGNTYWATMTAGDLYNNGNNVTVTFAPKPNFATGISLNKTSTSIQRGNTETLTATITPNNATNKTVTWTTSDPSVATVSSDGVVTAVSIGNATITATTNDGTNLSASCEVTVFWNAVTGISVSPETATVWVGHTTTLTASVAPANASNKTVTWSSSNTSVATVDANGVVTGVSTGNVTITATTEEGGYTASATITVIPVPVSGVTLNQSLIRLTTGTYQLVATVAPSDAANKNVTWTSANTAIATVSNTGVVTPVSPGTTTVTVTTEDGGYTATCTVKVQRRVWHANSYLINLNNESNYNTDSFTSGVQNVKFTGTENARENRGSWINPSYVYYKKMGNRSLGWSGYDYSSAYFSVTAPTNDLPEGSENPKIIGLEMTYDGDYHQPMTITANGSVISGTETAFGTTTTNTSEVTGYNTVSVTYSCTKKEHFDSRMRLQSLTVYYSYYLWEDAD